MTHFSSYSSHYLGTASELNLDRCIDIILYLEVKLAKFIVYHSLYFSHNISLHPTNPSWCYWISVYANQCINAFLHLFVQFRCPFPQSIVNSYVACLSPYVRADHLIGGYCDPYTIKRCKHDVPPAPRVYIYYKIPKLIM